LPTIKTHTALGITCGLAFIIAYKADSYTALSSSVIGAMVADIDTKKSAISSMFPIVNVPIDAMTKHRGIVHWGIPLIMIAMFLKYGDIRFMFLSAGSLSHLLVDIITKKIGITCNSRGEEVLYKLFWFLNGLLVSQLVYPFWWVSLVDVVLKRI
jgi:hypothetical protein